MKLLFSEHAWDDYVYWQRSNPAMLRRINALINDIQRDPRQGIGKPEALRHGLSGFWSRRINNEHRLVYKVEGDMVLIAQLRYHY